MQNIKNQIADFIRTVDSLYHNNNIQQDDIYNLNTQFKELIEQLTRADNTTEITLTAHDILKIGVAARLIGHYNNQIN